MAHTTRYGNTYTDEEWKEVQENFKQEQVKDEAILIKIDGMEKYLRRQLKEEKLNQKQINIVAGLFVNHSWEEANIQCTSQERQAKLEDLWKRWNIATDNLYNK